MSETDSEPVSAIGSGFVRFRLQRIDLLRKGWHLLTLATVLSHLSLFVLLLLSLRHMGVSADTVTGAEALAAFVVAAVLIYRALSYLVYFPLGLAAASSGDRGNHGECRPPFQPDDNSGPHGRIPRRVP